MIKTIRHSIALTLLAALNASASPIVYTPINPSFGGNPNNGSWLLGSAQAQNKTKDPNDPSSKSPMEQFNDMLQRALLSRVASVLAASMVNDDGTLKPGTYETTDFTITIVDVGNNTLQITTFDKNTGTSTTFEVTS